ncbi:hypothetical protein TNCV_2699531 [Trichonephila clavipes]|nr:hypothetical protein TNCV_2699531 [Trichonephila clavipes]
MFKKFSALLDCPTVSLEEFVTEDDDSDDENEMNNTAPVLTSSEMRNIMKSIHSYLDEHYNGEMNRINKKMIDVEQFDA